MTGRDGAREQMMRRELSSDGSSRMFWTRGAQRDRDVTSEIVVATATCGHRRLVVEEDANGDENGAKDDRSVDSQAIPIHSSTLSEQVLFALSCSRMNHVHWRASQFYQLFFRLYQLYVIDFCRNREARKKSVDRKLFLIANLEVAVRTFFGGEA